MLQRQPRIKSWIFLSAGGLQLLGLLFAKKHDSTWHLRYHFISRVSRHLPTKKPSLTGLFWVIVCKMTPFQLPRGSTEEKWMHFSKNSFSRPQDYGWSCENPRQIVASHRRFPSVTFINYCNLFPVSVSNMGQPSAAIVFLKAFLYWHTHISRKPRVKKQKQSPYFVIYACFVSSSVEKGG